MMSRMHKTDADDFFPLLLLLRDDATDGGRDVESLAFFADGTDAGAESA
eukprot:CAMPEP_0201243848 /NCGR_PEP_ID=MMETSP0852-20130820/42725_1 /ASSEMBLY_ACC=CAM_ASM_000632 /TAXON_ID=183588 /ORGANISM="Pseudo-nitzschia fraudulenta, Strain WWA7" /LENGTH=48 /DNA_ID= /DNA_START= /DNA_END= /DNA_ORIENTATION=